MFLSKNTTRSWLALTIMMAAGFSCGVQSDFYQKQAAVPGAAWRYDFQPEFKIHISDTAAHYRMFFLIRHDEAYPNANIWIRFKIKAPGDTAFHEGVRIDKTLADVEGKWLGKGMGNIWEHKLPLTREEMPSFRRQGDYTIRIEQIMRSNPLPSVLNVGLIVEKIR